MKFKLFDPKTDNVESVPEATGNYIVVLRKNCKLPSFNIPIIYSKYKGYDVIYTGISKNLQKRVIKNHFNGSAGRSTLRKSIGCMLGFSLIPRDAKYYKNKKTKFDNENERNLSDWMKTNLLLFYYPNNRYALLEPELIQKLNPPLNLDKNDNVINCEFRRHLRLLRIESPIVSQ